MPLHPLIVHFPIVLAVFLPVVIIAVMVAFRNSRHQRSAWAALLALSLILSAFSFTAMELGEQEEERVEKVIAEQVIEQHAEWGDRFAWATLAPVLILGGLVFIRNTAAVKAVALVSSLVVLGLGVKTGHSGAELVYKHNAAQVYQVGNTVAGENAGERGDHHDDHDDS